MDSSHIDWKRFAAFVLTVLLFLCSHAAAQDAQTLRAGVAAVSITPPNGTPLAGYYRKRLSEGVLDELHAKAIVFEQGELRWPWDQSFWRVRT